MNNSIPSAVPLISYIESEAQAPFSQEGTILHKGRLMTRLKLGEDSRFYVAARVVKWYDLIGYVIGKIGEKLNFYAEFKNGHDTVFVSIESLSQRLYISKAKIQKAAKNGTLPALLEQRAQDIAPIIATYEKIINKFGDKSRTGLLLKTLMKTIRTAMRVEPFGYRQIKIANCFYQIGFDKNKKEIELFTFYDVLEQGSYGEIRLIKHVFNATREVFKQARIDIKKKTKALADIKNEYNQLRYIHANGKVWGIQAPPRQIVQIEEDGNIRYGHIGLEYETTYESDLESKGITKFEDQLTDFYSIIFGLKELAERHIIHGDLKHRNILVKRESDGTKLVHLADFGGSRQVSNIFSLNIKDLAGANQSRSFTSSFSSFDDLVLGNKLADEGNVTELIELEKKRDVFFIGFVLHYATTAEYPFSFLEIDANEFPDMSRYKQINHPDVPPEIKELIASMLVPDYKKRPSAQEVFVQYNHFLKNNHPHIYQKILEKIQKDYPGSNLKLMNL
jgi:serine/threonine protein kinase